MKLYAFVPGNFLKESQCGIQTTHVLGEMISKYFKNEQFRDIVYEWASEHKTIILMDAKNADGVKSVLSRLQLSAEKAGAPFASFNESKSSFDGAITGCGFIAPSNIANKAFFDREDGVAPSLPDEWLDHWESRNRISSYIRETGEYHDENLINLINSHQLLR